MNMVVSCRSQAFKPQTNLLPLKPSDNLFRLQFLGRPRVVSASHQNRNTAAATTQVPSRGIIAFGGSCDRQAFDDHLGMFVKLLAFVPGDAGIEFYTERRGHSSMASISKHRSTSSDVRRQPASGSPGEWPAVRSARHCGLLCRYRAGCLRSRSRHRSRGAPVQEIQAGRRRWEDRSPCYSAPIEFSTAGSQRIGSGIGRRWRQRLRAEAARR